MGWDGMAWGWYGHGMGGRISGEARGTLLGGGDDDNVLF